MKNLLPGCLLALLSFTVGVGLVENVARPSLERNLREMILRQDLQAMRKAIDLFALDQGKLPQSLDDLAAQGYLREIPPDPMTNKKDWQVEFGEATGFVNGNDGIVDVHSSASGISASGIAFNDF